MSQREIRETRTPITHLFPEKGQRLTGGECCHYDGDKVSCNQGKHAPPSDAGAKEAVVEEHDGSLGQRDAGDVDENKGKERLPQAVELVGSHSPEVFSASKMNAEEAADGHAESHHLGEGGQPYTPDAGRRS